MGLLSRKDERFIHRMLEFDKKLYAVLSYKELLGDESVDALLLELEMSKAELMKWVKAFHREGLAGLLSKWDRRGGKGLEDFCEMLTSDTTLKLYRYTKDIDAKRYLYKQLMEDAQAELWREVAFQTTGMEAAQTKRRIEDGSSK